MLVFMRDVHCRNCGRPTRHPVAILKRIIELQSVSNGDGIWINYACPECNRLTRSLVALEIKAFEGLLSKFLDDVAECGVSLECAKSGCKSPVILLAPMRRDIDNRHRYVQENWEQLSAACLQDFPPISPLEVRVIDEWDR